MTNDQTLPLSPRTLGWRLRRLGYLSVGLLLIATACSTDSPVEGAADTITVEPTGSSCLTRQIDTFEGNAEVCIDRNGANITVRATGLEDGSTLTVTGSQGDTIDSEVDADQSVVVDLGGQIVASTFTVNGTWIDGEPVSLAVEYTE